MSKDQASLCDLLPLLESTDLPQLEQVKTTITDLLITDRGGVLLSSLVDYYLDSSSSQAGLILSSVREPNDKALLDKLNETLAKPGCRLASLTLLGYVVRKQPPWMHKFSRSPLLASLLKCLKTDSDVVVLITGVLVLITLLPMIPQAGKQHIYDFFDVFGRLASWSLRNPGQVHGVYLVHLHASVYSLFHRLYGMYPCNFISYLRSHYSMKENLDTFQQLVKPMLEHVRVHPELVTGTQDYELDPSRWKCYEIHDIVIECAKVSLDPKDSSCEEGYSSLPDPVSSPTPPLPSSPRPPLLSSSASLPFPHLTASPCTELVSSSGSCSTPLSTSHPPPPLSMSHPPPPLSLHQQTGNNCSYIKCQSVEGDVTWSPSSQCGLTTPPASRGISPTNVPESSLSSSQPLSRTSSISGVISPVALSPADTLSEEYHHVSLPLDNLPRQEGSVSQPMGEEERGRPEVTNNNNKEGGRSMSLTELSDFIKERELEHTTGTKERDDEAITEEIMKLTVSQPLSASSSSSLDTPQEPLPPHLASTPDRADPSAGLADCTLPWSFRPCFTPIQALLPGGRSHHSPYRLEEGGPALFTSSPDQGPVPPYEPLFQLALPRAASLFVGRKTQEVLQRAAREREKAGGGEGDEREEMSSLSPLEVLDMLILHGYEAHDSRRLSVPSKPVDWSNFGGSGQGEELQAVRSQVLLLHSQLQYERYKRQQHAMRNRRLLRRVINATALEEHNNSMKAQLMVQDVEIQSLRASLTEEQRRYTHLKHDTHTETSRLHTQIQDLQQQHQEYYTKAQKLQGELQECQSGLGHLEAELQKANNEAYNAEHQLTQLSVKLSSSEDLQQHMHLLNKQLLLLGETNRLLIEELERGGLYHSKELSMLQSSVSREQQRLRDSETQQQQKLEAANHRINELESQLAKKDQLIVDQKKLLEDVKAQAKAQLSACESRYVALRRVSQALQTEMLQLYSQTDLEEHPHPSTHPEAHSTRRPNGSGVAISTVNRGSLCNEPSPSFFINGGLEPLSTALLSSSPSLLSLSPIDSPLAVGSCPTEGSFLGQRVRQLLGQTGESQEGEGEEDEEEGDDEEEEEEEKEGTERSGPRRLLEEEAQRGRPSVGREGEERVGTSQTQRSPQLQASAHRRPASSDTVSQMGSSQAALQAPPSLPPVPVPGQATAQRGAPHLPPRALAQAVRQRRYELSIMDYDETLPEY